MHDTLHQEYYWTHIVNDVYQAVKDFQNCLKECTTYHHERHLKLFPAPCSLGFVPIDIAIPFPKLSRGNQIVVVITYHYSKLTRSIPRANVTAAHVVLIFLNHLVISYGLPNYLLSDNGTQFVGEFLLSLLTVPRAEETHHNGWPPTVYWTSRAF